MNSSYSAHILSPASSLCSFASPNEPDGEEADYIVFYGKCGDVGEHTEPGFPLRILAISYTGNSLNMYISKTGN